MRLIALSLAILLTSGCQSLPDLPKPNHLSEQERRAVEARAHARRLVGAVSKDIRVVVLVRGKAAHVIVTGPLTDKETVSLATSLMALMSFDFENVLIVVNNGVFRPGRQLRPEDGTL